MYNQSAFLVIKIAYMYYIENYSQNEIAKALQISVTTVSRMLKKAKQERIVEFVIRDPYVECISLEKELKETFGLKDVIIAPGLAVEAEDGNYLGDEESAKKLVALEGARYLQRIIKKNDVLGITWGSTIYRLINYLNPAQKVDATFVTLHGSIACCRNELDVRTLVLRMAKAFSGMHYYLLTEALMSSKKAADIIKQEKNNKKVFQMFDNKDSEIIAICAKEFAQYYPQPGWVEQDPKEIWLTTKEVINRVVLQAGIDPRQIKAAGITNQRETVVVYDKNTGEPVYNAIGWADRRTAPYCDELKAAGKEQMFIDKTGLLIDGYFSGTEIKWILDNVPGAREKAEAGDLYFSNIDGWIMYKLTEGKCHLTDYSNASRTQLFNIHTLEWDDDMLELFNIPKSMCPTALPSSGHFCTIERKDFFGGVAVPITGCIGDQQSATFGQCCFEPGMCKMTYGTAGCMLMNIGEEPIPSKNDLLLTIGWGLDGKVEYIYEGTVYNAGSSIQWLRDEMDMIDSTPDSEYYAAKSELPRGYVYVVPAFSGLGAPWYDSYARATIFGLHRGANKYDVIKATLDSLGYQTRDIANAMAKDAGSPIKLLRIDGGAANNNIVAQFVADILGADAERPVSVETTAAGAAYLAGLAVGFWKSKEEILACRKIDRLFHPEMPEEEREELYAGWVNCVESLMTWSKKAKQ